MFRITKTEQGIVEGLPAADPRITVFKGIPFAAPPVGNLRWAPPQEPAKWEG
ncbi:MAG: carboxylesterase family protein, partial [Treponema sp.]|nr:carboxylesterase family protein [Treponema sp.]